MKPDAPPENPKMDREALTRNAPPDTEAWVLFRLNDQEVIEVNDGFTRLLGYPRQVAVGRPGAALQLWQDPARCDFFLTRLQRDGKVDNLEARLRHADGHGFPVLLCADSICLNGQTYILVIGRDLGAQRRTETALALSEARFRQVFDHAPSGMALVDTEGCFLEINSALARMLGRSRVEVVGHHFNKFAHPEDRSIGPEKLRALMRRAPSLARFEKRYRRGDGGEIAARVTSTLMRDETGAPVFFIVHVEDASAQRSARAEREKLEAHLRQSAKLEAIATLAGGVAHDFNNLLMGIQGNVSLLRLDLDDDAPGQKRLADIENIVTEAKELTGQLLGFARGGKCDPQVMDLNALVRETIGSFVHRRRQLKVQVDLAGDLRPLRIDRNQFSQALMKLLENAGQAMADSGLLRVVTANVAFPPAEARSLKVAAGDYVCLKVIDNGAGMDPDTLEKVFDPFFSTRTSGRGSGLGLAATYGAVRQHGGIIQVHSEPGRGTEFTIYLPAATPPPLPAALPRQLVLPIGGQAMPIVLLVDDEPMILEVGAQLLGKLGFEVLTAACGREAVDLFARRHRDVCLVLLDLIMPEMGGAETFEALKEIDPTVPVLLSSGSDPDARTMNIMDRGCRGFIQKPFRLKDLESKLTEILGAFSG